ncbi:MAG TPA: hypothetical protein VG013_16365 [Gemmataceae bacterium]|jgi:anti-sigma factor RsiW|nr:hypothetical protein [Gemmataceae bacterium]
MSKPLSLTDVDRANLVAYLDGELDARASSALEAKLNLDPTARAEADTLRRTWELLDYLPKPAPSPTFTSRTLERVSAPYPVAAPYLPAARWRPWALGLGWAAAVLVAGVAGFAGGKWLPRHPPAPPPQGVPSEQHLGRDLRVIENLHQYEHVDDIKFLHALADPSDPDLFGDDNPDS